MIFDKESKSGFFVAGGGGGGGACAKTKTVCRTGGNGG